ncbi:MAG: hypothetical protein J0L82_19370 [Deltaproteobacteria bacterium]|jgi:hypothetical protein|nr:hypothetical protein [Deltaproteobacteria bacterium]
MKTAGLIVLVLFALGISQANALRVKEEQVILDELQDYELCQKRDYTGDWCHDALKRWVKEHPEDAFTAGKMTRKAMNHWAAIPFFHQAFEANKGDCKDSDVKLAVYSALELPSGSYADLVKQAKKIGVETCINETKTDLVAKASVGSYLFTNVCRDLSAKGLLTGLKKKKCEEVK